ncbi:MAG: CHASE domain-containing protein [Opitutaceae bacterium]|nr:CHASE domain-containing protein [Opitutaceae bacterium]
MPAHLAHHRTGGLPSLLRRHGAVLLTAAAGAGLSVLLFVVLLRSEVREGQSAFEAAARQRMEILRASVARALADLNALGGLYQTGLEIDRATFRKFVAPAFSDAIGLQALSWAPKIPAADRAQVEAAIRAEGYPDFTFTDRDPVTRRTQPAALRDDVYHAVVMVEPLAENRAAFGRVIAEPGSTSRLALETGRMCASVIMPLEQERSNKPGLILHLPIFRGPVPATVEERRERVKGFVTAVFRIADLVAPALANLEGMRVTVADARPDPRSVIYIPPSQDKTAPSRHLQPRSYELPFVDRMLVVTFSPTAAGSAGRHHLGSWITLACGLVITCLSTLTVAGAQRRSHENARANLALQAEVQVRKQAEEAAAAASRAKTSFVTHLSHEIRTPLNSILGYAQILERSRSLATADREAVGAISAGGFHLLGLLNSVLDLSRIEAGHAELHRVAVDLPALLEGVARMFRPRAAEKSIALRVEAHTPGGRGAVLGDEGKLRQVLINLTSNAVKFTPKGEVLIRVRAAEADHWNFEVIDTGIGLNEQDRRHLFRPFYQTAEGGREGGSGLGLAIARAHVHLMGGRLEVDSRRQGGTRFHFSLKLPAAVIAPSEGPMRSLPRLAPGLRIHALVIDDSRENRQILARLLSDIGCAVAEAGTARDARDLARQAPPDVVFLDVYLAETTGPELLAAMRNDGLAGDTPVLLHTAALLTREQLEELRTIGVDLLQKPFRVEDLCACLRRVPGVTFVGAPEQGPGDTPAPAFHDLRIPAELRDRLIAAAELHNTTVLKECLRELRQTDSTAAAFCDHLRQLLRTYDVDAIAAAVRGIGVDELAEARA